MSEYITAEQYESFTGAKAPDDFTAMLAQAQIIIDRLIGYAAFDKLPPQVKTDVQKATAFEVLYLDEAGGLSGVDTGSVSLGKYSYSSAQPSGCLDVGPGVQDILYPTGLLYRGCGVR